MYPVGSSQQAADSSWDSVAWFDTQKLPSNEWTLPYGLSMREKQGGKVNGQPNVMASEGKTSHG